MRSLASSLLSVALFVTCHSFRASPLSLIPQPPFFEPEYLPRKPMPTPSNNNNNAPSDTAGLLPSNLIEPEYMSTLPEARKNLHSPVSPHLDTTGQVTEVAEYINNNNNNKHNEDNNASPSILNFLELSTKVKVNVEQEHSESLFMDAVLTDNLEKEMKNVQKDEKFIRRQPSFFSSAFSSSTTSPASFFSHAKINKEKLEQAPSDTSKEFSDVFQQLAEKYEASFQNHFKSSTDIFSSSSSLRKNINNNNKEEDDDVLLNEKNAEPQILLPVPASLLFEIVSKYREQMQGKKPLVPAFVESGSRKSTPSLTNYLDPFPTMIPATVGEGGGGGGNGLGGGPLPSRPPNLPLGGVVSLGIQSPPPPLRPDNLPPPPYINPLVLDKEGGGDNAGAPTAAPKTT